MAVFCGSCGCRRCFKEELRERLLKRGEEIGVPNLIDMIATEEQGVSEDEIYAFLEQVGHPALTMESIFG